MHVKCDHSRGVSSHHLCDERRRAACWGGRSPGVGGSGLSPPGICRRWGLLSPAVLFSKPLQNKGTLVKKHTGKAGGRDTDLVPAWLGGAVARDPSALGAVRWFKKTNIEGQEVAFK